MTHTGLHAGSSATEIEGKVIYTGVDVGSATTKVVLIDGDRHLLGYSVHRSGTDLSATAQLCLEQAVDSTSLKVAGHEMRTISTGFGRRNVKFSDGHKTEISCQAKGCSYFFPEATTIIDIGGQDNKVMQLDGNGRLVDFKMNRKCAAGTGAFLEEMARRLDISLADLDGLARQSKDMVELGSFCTVFTATEVLEKIRQGREVADIVKGLFLSVIKRVLEMDLMGDEIVATGGVVAFNPYLVDMLEEIVRRPVLVPPHAQLTGAWGAALFALEV